MTRIFENIWVAPDRGDGKPFVQVNFKDEFAFLHTKEIADWVAPGLLVALGNIIANIKRMTEDNEIGD